MQRTPILQWKMFRCLFLFCNLGLMVPLKSINEWIGFYSPNIFHNFISELLTWGKDHVHILHLGISTQCRYESPLFSYFGSPCGWSILTPPLEKWCLCSTNLSSSFLTFSLYLRFQWYSCLFTGLAPGLNFIFISPKDLAIPFISSMLFKNKSSYYFSKSTTRVKVSSSQ